MRWNIASAARVTIFTPRPADLFALFDDEKRLHAGFEELDAHADARKASANDQNVNSSDGRVGRRSGGFGHARATTSRFKPASTVCAWKKSALSRSDWRASGIRCGASGQACGTTGQIFCSTETPAARARSARRVESPRKTSSAPT